MSSATVAKHCSERVSRQDGPAAILGRRRTIPARRRALDPRRDARHDPHVAPIQWAVCPPARRMPGEPASTTVAPESSPSTEMARSTPPGNPSPCRAASLRARDAVRT